MSKSKSITVEITEDELRRELRKRLSGNCPDLVCGVIMGHLSARDLGLKQLFRALNGIGYDVKWRVGQKVWVSIDQLPSWQIKKEEMVAANLVFQGMVAAVVKSIDPFVSDSVKITYKKPGKDGKLVDAEYDFDPEDVTQRENFTLKHDPGNSDQTKTDKQGDDLPF